MSWESRCCYMNNEKIIKLPPFKIEKVFSTLSQTIDWSLKKLNIPETWKVTQGEGIKVLILDTGFPTHPDLDEALVRVQCRNFTDDKSMKDASSHSTMCAGIIGARNNDFGVVGVAPMCQIITGKVLDDSGTGSYQNIIDGLKYALEIKPDIVSMSLGGSQDDQELHDLIKKLTDIGIPVIVAAGNDGGLKEQDNRVNYPGKYDEVITVGSFNSSYDISYFSSWGDDVDILAPGENIYSTTLDNKYAKGSGTSFATPFVAGVVALLLAKHRKQEQQTGNNDCKTVDQIKEHLYKYSTNGKLGKNIDWGWGAIDPVKIISENDTATSIIDTNSKPLSFWQKVKKLFGM